MQAGTNIGTSSVKKVTYKAVISGKPKVPMNECKERLRKLSIDLTEWHSACSFSSTERSLSEVQRRVKLEVLVKEEEEA